MVEPSYDVFLSHNSLDKPSVERIAAKLQSAGLQPWLDTWYLVGGEPWQDELANALRSSATCAVFVSPNDLTGWAHEELGLARERAVTDSAFRLVPVLLPGLPEPLDPTSLPAFLATRTWVDFRKGVDDPDAFQALINAIKGIPHGPVIPTPSRTDVCPYRGLRTFDQEDAEFFFGRDADVQRLLEKLKAVHLLAVLGASGSGKSSLVRAGLIPAIRKGGLPASETWKIIVVRPGANPLTSLAASLLHHRNGRGMQQTLDELGQDPRSLHLATTLALSDSPVEARVVYIVDQFEEVFTLCADEAERTAFFDNLLFAATVPGGQGIVALTMRADFYPSCAPYPQLRQQLASHQFLVGPMDSDGLRQAIEEPARAVGLEFESGLIATILADTRQKPGVLPLLEHALLELWKRRRGQMLTLQGYIDAGGVSGAIAQHAEAIFARLTTEQQAVARRVLLRLIQPGEGTEDTRRRALVGEILLGEEGPEATRVLEKLIEARMLIAGADGAGSQGIELSHEALIREWPRVQGWLEEDRAGLLLHRRLTEAAGEWESHGHDRALLYRGVRLSEAVSRFARNTPPLNPTERAFLTAGLRARRGGRVIRASVLLILIALILGGAWTLKPNVESYLLRRDALAKSPMATFAGSHALLGDDAPEHKKQRVYVGPFALDIHEVTNEQYRLCVEAGACSPPLEESGAVSYLASDPALPVVYVTAQQAATFCRWLDRRLPSEAEWERAARGTEGRPWPWGHEAPKAAYANLSLETSPSLGLVAVDTADLWKDVTPEGVSHLAGNAMEWTRTPAPCEPNSYACPSSHLWDGQRRVASLWVRGNGWEDPWSSVTGADALPTEPVHSARDTGFRCATTKT